jgi:hypothetical protein
MTIKYETRAVLAGAYRVRIPFAALLRHTIAVESNGGPFMGERVLCGRVKVEHLADPYALNEDERAGPPTCEVCLRRDPRFAGAGTTTQERDHG